VGLVVKGVRLEINNLETEVRDASVSKSWTRGGSQAIRQWVMMCGCYS
jgi:hypothetical protein